MNDDDEKIASLTLSVNNNNNNNNNHNNNIIIKDKDEKEDQKHQSTTTISKLGDDESIDSSSLTKTTELIKSVPTSPHLLDSSHSNIPVLLQVNTHYGSRGIMITLSINNLPSELLVTIFMLLGSLSDIARLSLVSHYFNKIASTNEIWQSIYMNHSFNRSAPIFKTNIVVDFKEVLRIKQSTLDNWRSGRYKPTVLKGHSEPISSLIYNGTFIISSSYDRTIRIWDYETLECKFIIAGVTIEQMQLDCTNTRVVCGTKDGFIKVINIERGKLECSKKLHYGYISALRANYNSTIFASGSKDRCLKIWSVINNNQDSQQEEGGEGQGDESFKLIHSVPLPNEIGAVVNIEWCEYDRNHLVTAASKDISVIDSKTGQIIRSLQGHTGSITCFEMRGNTIVSASTDLSLRVWDCRDSTSILTIQVPSKVYCLKFEPKNNLLVTGSMDNEIRYYRLSTGELIKSFRGHTASVTLLHMDTNHVISGSLDRNLWVLNSDASLAERSPGNDRLKLSLFPNSHKLDGHESMIRCAHFDESKIISGSHDYTVRIWDFAATHKRKGKDKSLCKLM